MLKTIKKIVIVILLLTVVLLGGGIFVFNKLMARDWLVPTIENLSQSYLDADVKVEDAEVTFFSTFPRFGIELKGGSIACHQFNKDSVSGVVVDSLRSRIDTLLTFEKGIVGFNLREYLLGDGSISIGYLRLDRPINRIMTDSLGRSSYDIVKEDTDTAKVEADTTSTGALKLNHVRLNNARIALFDQPSQTFFFADSLTLKADGDLGETETDAEIALDIRRTSLGVRKTRFFRRLPIGLEGRIYFNEEGKYQLDETLLTVDGTDINLDGWVQPDTAGADIDIRYQLKSPSVERLFQAIPKTLIDRPVEIKEGSLDLAGTVIGRADTTSVPVFEGKAYVKGVRAHWEGMPKDIEDLTGEFNVLIDKSRPKESYVNVNIENVKGGKSSVKAIVELKELLEAPQIDSELDAHIDLKDAHSILPLENMKMDGIVDAKLKVGARIEEVMRFNLSSLSIGGKATAKGVVIEDDSLNFRLRTEMKCRFMGGDTLGVHIEIPRFGMRDNETRILIRDGRIMGKAKEKPDTSRVTPMEFETGIARAYIRHDSVRVMASHIRTKDYIEASAVDKKLPHLHSDLTADTVRAGIYGIGSQTTGLSARADLRATGDTVWEAQTGVKFDEVLAQTPFSKLPIISRDGEASQDGSSVTLKKMRVKIGKSEMTISGESRELFNEIANNKEIRARIEISADTIDCNEIVSSLLMAKDTSENVRSATIESDSTLVIRTDSLERIVSADTLRQQMLLIPNDIALDVKTTANVIVWDKARITNIRSNIKTNKGALHVTNFFFRMGKAKALTTMAYKAYPQAERARMTLYTHAEQFDIEQIMRSFSLDSIVPALKPMRGAIDCYLGAKVEFDKEMNPNLKTSRASIHLGGQRLTLLENEQFKKIAKSLFFKDKKRNIVDTLSVNILVDAGRVMVLPFVTEIDRYRMAVKGSQDLDMNMDYHASILKSPLPFKIGVNIKGKPGDIDVDVTTAKLKKQVTPEKLAHSDSVATRLRRWVLMDSYVLSGLPLPDFLKQDTVLLKMHESMSKYAVEIKADESKGSNEGDEGEEGEEDDEEGRKDLEMAKKMQEGTLTATEQTDDTEEAEESKKEGGEEGNEGGEGKEGKEGEEGNEGGREAGNEGGNDTE